MVSRPLNYHFWQHVCFALPGSYRVSFVVCSFDTCSFGAVRYLNGVLNSQ